MKTLAQTLTGQDLGTLKNALPALRKVLTHVEYNTFASWCQHSATGDAATIVELTAQLRGATAFADLCASLSTDAVESK